jgi:RNA polymerase sigma factor (sigma-70 family)
MANTSANPIVQMIRHLADDHRLQNLPDQELLERFRSRQDQVAFAALLRRHGPMVLDVCRNVARNDTDAEDAFQATFLILTQKARSIRNLASVGSWLYGVAYRIALKARAEFAKRHKHELRVPRLSGKETADDLPWYEVQHLIHAELTAFSERYRAPLVLCCLEGRTQDEAARHLGISRATLKKRLERGRLLLRSRLVRRGLGPAAFVAATAWPAAQASACLPTMLASATVKVATAVVAGGSTAGLIPSHIVALMASVSQAMTLTKAKIATAVALAVFLCSGGAVLIYQTVAASGSDNPAPQKTAMPAKQVQVQPPAAKDDDSRATVTYAGRVLGTDNKPVPGAKVYYHFFTHEDEALPVRAATDAEGRFSFTLSRKDVPLSAEILQLDPLKMGQVVVKADGFAIAWLFLANQVPERPLQMTNLTLHMKQDTQPIEGRILDLQGKPLAGLRVSTLSAWASENGDLSEFLKALRSGDILFSAINHLPNFLGNIIINRNLAQFLPSANTGADGRFRIHGFTREQLVALRIEGPTIETQNLYVLTRVKPPATENLLTVDFPKDPLVRRPPAIIHWNGFDHAAPPGQIVTGTVRDEATKMPIPGAIVESYMLAGSNLGENAVYHTIADANGHYRFTGLPRENGNSVRIRPPDDQPSIPAVKVVPPWKAFTETTLDAELQRGVWIDVTAKDKTTGKPIPGNVSYFVLPDLPAKDEIMERPFADAFKEFMPVRTDGTLRFAGLPRRAIVAFQTDRKKYPRSQEAATIQLPGTLAALNFHAFVDVFPKADDESVKVEFVLETGGIAQVKLIGPDGQPVSGALAAGLCDDWSDDIDPLPQKAEFTALGLKADRPRLLCFAHEEMKLAGSVVVRGDEKDAVTVKLVPWGTVSGRLLDTDGKPIRKATLAFTEIPQRQQGQPRMLDTGLHVVVHWAYQKKPDPTPRTDAEGRFRVEALVPGLKYNLAWLDAGRSGLAFSNLILEPGETRDLGDVKLQLFPKSKTEQGN